jgi:hypothetical protein
LNTFIERLVDATIIAPRVRTERANGFARSASLAAPIGILASVVPVAPDPWNWIEYFVQTASAALVPDLRL